MLLFQSAKHKVRYWDGALQATLSLMLSSLDVHTTKTVDQLLFKGYDDTLIELGKMAAGMGEDVPPFDKFGWFYMVRWRVNNSRKIRGII